MLSWDILRGFRASSSNTGIEVNLEFSFSMLPLADGDAETSLPAVVPARAACLVDREDSDLVLFGDTMDEFFLLLSETGWTKSDR
jgi:hypothetical protein